MPNVSSNSRDNETVDAHTDAELRAAWKWAKDERAWGPTDYGYQVCANGLDREAALTAMAEAEERERGLGRPCLERCERAVLLVV